MGLGAQDCPQEHEQTIWEQGHGAEGWAVEPTGTHLGCVCFSSRSSQVPSSCKMPS